VRCVYDGPSYDGYACDFEGNFWVTVTGCTASYATVDWGDGTVVTLENLPPDSPVYHTYNAPGIYYTYLSAEFNESECQNQGIDLTFVFEYPSGGEAS
jgi:hypothetical protein